MNDDLGLGSAEAKGVGGVSIPRTLGSMSHQSQVVLSCGLLVLGILCGAGAIMSPPGEGWGAMIGAAFLALTSCFVGVTSYYRSSSDPKCAVVEYRLFDKTLVFKRRLSLDGDSAYCMLLSESDGFDHSGESGRTPSNLHRVFIGTDSYRVTVKCFYTDSSRPPTEAIELRDRLATFHGVRRA